MDKFLGEQRKELLLQNCISYLCELKERDNEEEKLYFWKNKIGMTDKELKYYEVLEY